QPCTVIIFGASGDLTKRKLVPALYKLSIENLLGPGFSVVGTARTPMTHDAFRTAMLEGVKEFAESGPPDPALWNNFASGIFYTPTDTSDPESYTKLSQLLDQIDRDRGTLGNRLFYLSTPPTLYGDIVRALGASGLNKPADGGWRRIIIEK